MPGPVSDSYDPEWGTGDNREKIACAMKDVYGEISNILGNPPPVFILQLLEQKMLDGSVTATLSIKQWRIIRFALERAGDSL